MRIVFIIILMVCSLNVVLSQTNVSKVEITASYDDEDQAILLRWAPNDPVLWLKTLKNGYTLEKYVYQRDGKLLPVPLEKEIIYDSIVPEELNNWEGLVNQNDYAAIAAQCIYGDYIAFDGANSDIFSIVNKSEETESRFSMALFAADQSVKVAKQSGLYYKDYDVKKNERYLYLVYSNYKDSLIQADTGAVYYGAADYYPNPSPRMSHAIQEGGNTQILWYNSGYSSIYTSFILEKATDNFNFRKINELPLINITEGPTKSGSYSSFVDTVSNSGKVYYRVKGKDIFGNISSSSDTLLVESIPDYITPMPSIDSIFIDKNNHVQAIVSISGDKQYVNNIFFERSTKADGRYQLIDKSENLKHNFIDKKPIPNNYYRVGVSFFNSVQYSLPILYNLIDSIPPGKPIIQDYKVKDSLLTLSWEQSAATDIANYRLYKSQFKNSEPSLVAEINAPDTLVTLIENLKFINNKRYYYLTAVDKVGNTSDLSEAFRVELPDIVPPVEPVIKNIEQRDDSIFVNWEKSSSEDIKNFLIYRKGNGLYELIGVKDPLSTQFIDLINAKNNTSFSYRLVAVDSSANESVSKPVSFKYSYKDKQNVKYEISISDKGVEVYWVATSNKYRTCNIYLKQNESLNLIKSIDFKEGQITFQGRQNLKKEDIKVIFL